MSTYKVALLALLSVLLLLLLLHEFSCADQVSEVEIVDNTITWVSCPSHDSVDKEFQRGPLDGLLCRRRTCEWCGNNLRNGFCSICDSGAENSFVYDPNSNSFNDPPNFFNHPPQPQTYSCELCGNDSHYGYDCPPRVPLVYEQEPCYNQNFGDNYYPQNSPSFPQQYLCCENCGGPHENFQCQPRNQNYFESNPCYNPNSYGFDQPTQTSIDHQPPKETSVRELLLQEKLHKALQAVCEKLNQQEQAANVSTHTLEPSRCFNFIYYDDDDDEEITIPLNEITSQIPPSIAITPVLPTMEPEDSLIMGDENHSTIPEKESSEFIKSSVDDLVPIPSESEDTSYNDSECDLPFCDNSVTFSNPLFDANDDFTSSDNESLPEEDVQEENFKIYSNPLFEFDEEYIPSDVNPLFNKVLEDIENKDSYVSNLDEPALLVTPLSDANEDECFDPGGDIDEIDAFLDIDVSMNIEDDYHDSEGDIIYLESLLINNTTHNLPPKVFLDHDPKSLNNKPNNLKSMVKVFDPGIWEKFFSPTYVKLPFEDRHYLSLTYVIQIFLPYFTYSMNSSLHFSSGSEDTIFGPRISAFHFSSLEPVVSHRSGTFMFFNVYLNILNESQMEICSSTRFNPNIKMIWGESS
ncbi:hypothetical protein Tco_1018888 [Tanacetum coccineum]|uniref:Uncharacterized protein n=1 Tax=Tanacetum coccineum TaxID=301880 RepID=A0ABQ5FVN1_9ASTR